MRVKTPRCSIVHTIVRASFCLLVTPPLLAACTPVKDVSQHSEPSSASEPIDFEGRWSASGYPCGADPIRIVLTIREQDGVLIAASAETQHCVTAERVIWVGSLAGRRITRADLPVSFAIELTLSGEDADTVAGSATIASPDRMLIQAQNITLTLAREAGESRANHRSNEDPTGHDASGQGPGTAPKPPAAESGTRPPQGGASGATATGTSGSTAVEPVPPKPSQAGASGGGGATARGDAGASGMGGAAGARASAGVSGAVGVGAAGRAAGSGGATAMPPSGTPNDGWNCSDSNVNAGECICQQGIGPRVDTCTQKPSCCFDGRLLGRSCHCWIRDEAGCAEALRELGSFAKRVSTCPPP